MSDEIIRAENINLVRNDVQILHGANWQVKRGENWALIGLNGSGKTSLLRAVTGDFWPTSGSVWLFGGQLGHIDLPAYKKRVGWVGGAIDKWLPPSETALHLVVTGLHHTYELYRKPTDEENAKGAQILAELGCAYLSDRPFSKLSQGEKQKIRLARALVAGPELLILDEVCAGLDIKSRENLLQTIETMDVPAIMFVTHHIEEIPAKTDNIIAMKKGCVAACGKKETILTDEVLSDVLEVPLHITADKNGRYWSRVNTACAIL